MNKAKTMADFLVTHLKFPDPLPKGAALYFLLQLSIWLDRIGVRHSVRQIDVRPSKARMFIAGWEAEDIEPEKVMVLDVDDALIYEKGDFINTEENRRIHSILPVTKFDLNRKGTEARVGIEKKSVITSYLNSLSSEYYGWLVKRTKQNRLTETEHV